MARYRISYAQNREDIILSGFFEGIEKGFYVDVGANHPDKLSLTRIFYDQGWRGINIEPNKQLYNLIEKSRPKDTNLNIGAADESGELTLREYPDGDGLSTFSKDAQQEYAKDSSAYRDYTRRYKDYVVKVQPLAEIFKEHDVKNINFMNIDVEGFEYEVINGNNWEKYRPQVLCIEANHIVNDWRPLLKKANYELAFFDGLNNYYVAKECPEILKKFSYVDTMLLGKPVLPAHFIRTLEVAEANLRNTEIKLTRQRLVEAELRTEIHNLYSERFANRRIKALVKLSIVAIHIAILTQIEKLNKPKLKHQKPIKLNDKPDKAELLQRIKQNDLERYFKLKSQPLSYKIIHGAYSGTYESLKSSFRYVWRKLRGRQDV